MTKPFDISPIFDNNFNCTKAIVVNQGGTSSGKTYSILQVLFCKAAEERNIVITVVGQDMPNLKVGAIRDFDKILDSSPFFSSLIANVNKSDRIYTFRNGSKIEFKSYEDAQDAKNGKRDYLFLNEANGISYAIFEELQVRTTKQVFLDYNPTVAFWVHEKLIGREDVQLFISNYTHNPFLDDEIKRKIEYYKDTDVKRWRVYGLGLTGTAGGNLILGEWFKTIKLSELPFNPAYVTWNAWIDGAWTEKTSNDPTAVGYEFFDKVNNILYIRGMFDFRKRISEAIEHFKSHSKAYGINRQSLINIELKSSGEAFRDFLFKDGFNCTGINNATVALGKLTRVEGSENTLRGSRVVLIEDGAWTKKFIEQCESFPNGTHDDMVDLLCYMVYKYFITGINPHLA